MSSDAPALGPALRGRTRLLVIDDETVLLACFSRMLRSHHDVEIAVSATLALSLLDASAPFDLVICDLNLPDIAGRDFYGIACDRRPELRDRFLFMTGDRATNPHDLADGSSAVRVLAKPFDSAALLTAIGELLVRLPPRGK